MFKLEQDEHIVKVVRRHYFVILPMILSLVAAALLPIVLHQILVSGFLPFEPSVKEGIESFASNWKQFGFSLWFLFLWILFFVEWTDYYLDIWILTNKRIIDVEQNGFFHREVTSFTYNQIQDITVETKGLMETFFKFGTLHIQTAGHNRNIIIKDAHYPEDARALVLRLQQVGGSASI